MVQRRDFPFLSSVYLPPRCFSPPQDRRFDDVVRVVPPPIEGRKKEVELDDSKAKAGLGELYEQDYVRQVRYGRRTACQ